METNHDDYYRLLRVTERATVFTNQTIMLAKVTPESSTSDRQPCVRAKLDDLTQIKKSVRSLEAKLEAGFP